MDWLSQIWEAISSRAGCTRGYMAATVSLKFTSRMDWIWLLSTVTSTSSALPLKVMGEV